MLERLFGFLKRQPENAELFVPRMPDVRGSTESIEDVFERARQATLNPVRHVVVVTPERMLMLQPCPPPASMKASEVSKMEGLVSSKVKRNVAVIAYTDQEALKADVTRAIPFIGLLMGLAYIGHSVWVFEGELSALPAGCRDADFLLIDGGMLPHL